MRPLIGIAALAVAVGAAALALPGYFRDGEPGPVARPIIAQLYAHPDKFIGLKVEVYGLVVQSEAKGEFFLQDVSQRPLRVLGDAAVGDQLTALGSLRADGQTIYLKADQLIPTKVTGGGGCC